ncbi:MAG TPA: ubiquinol-cytochrome c reductase iron-sulfur subunit [Bryobacteraceae bacterium]|nr:ubiquinol-cytochrome c reductase iron-sulfur subunit [Bryobacteraceae bacterium]
MDKHQGPDRRSFHVSVIYAMWAVITGALTLPAAIYLLVPPKSKKNTSEWIEAGDISQLKANVPEEFVFRRNRLDGWKVTSEKTTAWVIKQGDSDVVAFTPQCTHLGCAYSYDDKNKEFLCPCHTSTFGLDGKVLTGPAPRALDRYETKIAGSKLMLGDVRKGDA